MRMSHHRARRFLLRTFCISFLLVLPWGVVTGSPGTINDITQLNPIQVQHILSPTTLDEIVDAVKAHPGPISIGGGRFSKGGQIATKGALYIDMRKFNKVIHFSKERKAITVQSGMTWRMIQEYVDPYDLSLSIMQTYSNFTVGGSLSVNAHGRYNGQGPIVYSVNSIRIVLPSGKVVEASTSRNRDIFYGAIGGYGALGVIVEATLALTENLKVERQSVVMPLNHYKNYFFEKIHGNTDVIFHNADIFPTAFNTVRAISHVKTSKPLTVEHRLVPKDKHPWLDRFCFWVISEWPYGKVIRQHVIDRFVFRDARVVWRNYEASYDVQELEPVSRKNSTYVLQEYFVPVDKLDQFVPIMAEVLHRHAVNAINVSIRHAKHDPGTLLAWARSDVFAFVLYYKQGTSETDGMAVGIWTRELIEAAISMSGTYYLPYQIHATERQFHAAYPGAQKFFTLKMSIDPTNKFRNKLWDIYYRPSTVKRLAVREIETVAATPQIADKSVSPRRPYVGTTNNARRDYISMR